MQWVNHLKPHIMGFTEKKIKVQLLLNDMFREKLLESYIQLIWYLETFVAYIWFSLIMA